MAIASSNHHTFNNHRHVSRSAHHDLPLATFSTLSPPNMSEATGENEKNLTPPPCESRSVKPPSSCKTPHSLVELAFTVIYGVSKVEGCAKSVDLHRPPPRSPRF
ncbi:hypothetical protein L484_004507 [Morus notabilis]|uniref:Uncharacterized protein n=1 Tax=Morus notabilis TaxID=981085 RepID=W9QTP9_9ROSA|nr:hypothetical protein L484_004507 [Morus notabilis]